MPLLHTPAAFLGLLLILGLCVGSFLNVIIHRLPRMMERQWLQEAQMVLGERLPEDLRNLMEKWWTSYGAKEPAINLATPRSRCPHCGHPITALENVPLISYLFLRGRCRSCKAPISLRYPIIEVFTAILSVACGWHFGPTLACAGALVFVWCMVALAGIDLDTQLLPDDITLPLLWMGLLANLQAIYVPLDQAVIGAVVGYLSLWSVYWLFKLVTGKEGMGYGDFKLLAAIGAWLGWQALPMVILLSSVVGACVGVALILFARHKRDTPIPFGPYLAAAGVLALFLGGDISALLPG